LILSSAATSACACQQLHLYFGQLRTPALVRNGFGSNNIQQRTCASTSSIISTQAPAASSMNDTQLQRQRAAIQRQQPLYISFSFNVWRRRPQHPHLAAATVPASASSGNRLGVVQAMAATFPTSALIVHITSVLDSASTAATAFGSTSATYQLRQHRCSQ
jgi:hypothetical protein